MFSARTLVRALSVAFLLNAIPSLATAADVRELGHPYLENFTARDYHGQPGLFSPVQGADGLMYFVNFGSVVIYDGRSWENIPVSDRPLLCVMPAADGSIYVSPIDDVG